MAIMNSVKVFKDHDICNICVTIPLLMKRNTNRIPIPQSTNCSTDKHITYTCQRNSYGNQNAPPFVLLKRYIPLIIQII